MSWQRSRIVAADKQHVWHPYTAMDRYVAETQPLVIHRAQGARLFDADGRSFLDGNSSWWTMLLGHGHPRIVKALTEQAATLAHTSLAGVTHEPAARLAEALAGVAPADLEHVFYSDNGSTAIEVAVKLAVQFWSQNGRPRRTRFVALDGAFHGETLAPTALGGVEVFRRPFAGVLMDCVHVPFAQEGYEAAFAAIEKVVQEAADEIAAVVVEPIVQGVAGMRMYPPEYLRRVRELTRRHDVFLVCDEVFTGYGRTGPMWASQHADVAPDILCLGKGFTAGTLPMAATLATRRIFDGFLGGADRAFYYGHTFCGNPLGARVALEVLDVYREEQVLEGVVPRARKIADTFKRLGQLPGVQAARTLGMVAALELEGGEGYLQRGGWRVYEAALARGAYMRPLGNVVYLTPPLNIPEEDLDELLAITEESLLSVLKQ